MRVERGKRLLRSRTMILLFPFIALGEKENDKQKNVQKRRRQKKKTLEKQEVPAGKEATKNVNTVATYS